MKLWIARNQNGSLNLFINGKPAIYRSLIVSEDISEKWFMDKFEETGIRLDNSLFPEVTYENSPQEVELKLINK